ncbi:hypothetical protein CapIbe_011207 [Capra ibex]
MATQRNRSSNRAREGGKATQRAGSKMCQVTGKLLSGGVKDEEEAQTQFVFLPTRSLSRDQDISQGMAEEEMESRSSSLKTSRVSRALMDQICCLSSHGLRDKNGIHYISNRGCDEGVEVKQERPPGRKSAVECEESVDPSVSSPADSLLRAPRRGSF